MPQASRVRLRGTWAKTATKSPAMTKPRFPWKYRGALAASLLALAYPLTCTVALAGLTFELHLYRTGQGESYGFYTPLYTNATAPAAPLGTYLISSPHQPTNGSNRAFQLTTN